jgi:phage tail P2-like protein
MKMTIQTADVIKLLPAWMRDDEANKALAAAVSRLFRDASARINTIRVWDQIEKLNDEELDEMAWELNIDWYSSAMDIERKRATIKTASQVMEKRGTKWAVEQLISAYVGTGDVEEWFENGGAPFTFKVKTTNPNIGDEGMANFIKQVGAAKSERSHLDGVFYFMELTAPISIAPTETYQLFEYTKCGTRPRRATLGAQDIQSITVESGAYHHGFDYRRAGDGTTAGTFPETSTLGTIRGGTIAADGVQEACAFNYGTTAGDGTAAGTFPRRTSLGSVSADQAEASVTTNAHCFAYVRCGTRRCGQI